MSNPNYMAVERDAFAWGICAHPADDNVRMVYADWLQDHGEEARAEFIRDQIEFRPGARDFDLLCDNWDRWYTGVRLHEEQGFYRDKGTGGIVVTFRTGGQVVFSRGFVHEVRFLRPDRYISAAEAGYWRHQPICRVRISDRHPEQTGDRAFRWFIDGQLAQAQATLPEDLWRAFHDGAGCTSLVRQGLPWEFEDAVSAYEGMSAGAVALGRMLANLPPLPGPVAPPAPGAP